VQLVTSLAGETVMLPSFATSHSPFRRPPGWFVLGTGTARVACELHAQLARDGRTHPFAVVDPNGFNNLVGWELTLRWGVEHVVLPSKQAPDTDTIGLITSAEADAYVLGASPASASALLFALAATGNLGDPRRWYLTHTLHTPALLETIPKSLLDGARGVAPGTADEAKAFRARFFERWQDAPLDDAYPFYDAAAVVILAAAHALATTGAVASGEALRDHVFAVTRRGATPVRWDQLGAGLMLLQQHQEISYLGLSGPVEFDISGLTAAAGTRWLTIGPGGFEDVPDLGDCP